MRLLTATIVLGLTLLGGTLYCARSVERPAISTAPDAPAPPGGPARTTGDGDRASVAEPRLRRTEQPSQTSQLGGDEGGSLSRDVEYARKYGNLKLAELEALHAELVQRSIDERESLFAARFEGGRFESATIRSTELAERERKLAAHERELGAICKSRCVYPDPASGGGLDLPFDFQSTCLTRDEYPDFFALLDETQWVEDALERQREPEDDDER
jgi:hypothetical protein